MFFHLLVHTLIHVLFGIELLQFNGIASDFMKFFN